MVIVGKSGIYCTLDGLRAYLTFGLVSSKPILDSINTGADPGFDQGGGPRS